MPQLRTSVLAAMVVFTWLIAWPTGCQHRSSYHLTDGNLILVTVDTLRADHVHCYGYSRPTTPYIDALAARGTLFSLAIAQAVTTSPSHASIFTGLNPSRHGLRKLYYQLDPANQTLAEILRERDYETAAFVSGLPVSRASGLDQGFNIYDEPKNDRQRPADQTTEKVLQWLQGAPKSKFFLWVHYFDPHFPYSPPQPYQKRFLPPGASPRRIFPLNLNSYPQLGSPSSDVVEEAIALYDGEIAFVDRNVGKLVAAVEELGLADRTLLIVTSDHGECLGEHGYFFAHWDVYDPTVRVPLIIAHPWKKLHKRRVDELVRSIDILPTALDILDVPSPPNLQGKSLVPSMLGVKGGARWAYSEHVEYEASFGRALRGRKWKLIDRNSSARKSLVGEGPVFRPEQELYDLQTDPSEEANVFPAEQAIASQLQTELSSVLQETPSSAPGREVDSRTKQRLRALGYYVK